MRTSNHRSTHYFFDLIDFLDLKSCKSVIRVPHRGIGVPDIVVKIEVHILFYILDIVLKKSSAVRYYKCTVNLKHHRIATNFLNYDTLKRQLFAMHFKIQFKQKTRMHKASSINFIYCSRQLF